MLDDPTPAFLKLCIQLLSNRNAVDESGDLDPDVCSSIYTICRILSHHEPVPRGIAALSCCYCIATVSFQSAPLDHTMFGMRAPELCELMKSGDPSNTLDVVTSFMDADGGVIFSLPPEDRKMVAEIEETLWSGYKRSIVHKSKCISILAEVDEWKEICKFMSSSPFPHTWGGRDETLPCAIHGVSIPGGVFQLLCNSSPTRPGVGSLRQQGGEVEGPLAKDIHRCFRDKSPAIRRSRHDRQWVEGEASTFCSCAQCQTCALGCGRRSIHHIVGRVYSSLESTDDADDVVVPLGRILWRVAWKKILFVHPRVSLCSEMFDASVANVTFRSEVGIIELEDKWVHLDVTEETLDHIAKFGMEKGGGHTGIIYSDSGDLLAVVVSKLSRGEYEVLVQGKGSLIYTWEEIGDMCKDGGSDDGVMREPSVDLMEEGDDDERET